MSRDRYSAVYRHFAALIDNGKMKPGEQLPTHSEIGKAWNISHVTVMKAVKALREDAYVETSTAGTFVCENRGALLYEKLRYILNQLESTAQGLQVEVAGGVPCIVGRDGGVCWDPEVERWENLTL